LRHAHATKARTIKTKMTYDEKRGVHKSTLPCQWGLTLQKSPESQVESFDAVYVTVCELLYYVT
jgi:hypothetical protein